MFSWLFRNRDRDDLWTEWTSLLKELWKRLYQPIFQPAYVFFFAISMVVGATGVWVAIIEVWLTTQPELAPALILEDPSVFNAILTYSAALGSLSCIQVIVIEDRQKHLRSLLCLVLIACIYLAVLAALNEHHSSGAGYPYLIAGTFLAVLTWWIANSDEKKFVQQSSPDPLGGHSDVQPAGETEGYVL